MGTKKLYTIGEVSEITGINKRRIKYYVECKIINPSHCKKEGGKKYGLYSEYDILKIRQIALYRELGYSTDDIRKMISISDFDWRKALDKQIEELKNKKRHLENVIYAAEVMRYANETEEERINFDISDFDNDIDQFTVSTFSCDEDELTSQSLYKIEKDYLNNLNLAEVTKQSYLFFDKVADVKKAMKYSPESKEMQDSLDKLFEYLAPLFSKKDIDFYDIIFCYRLFSNLSLDRVIDIVLSYENAADYIAKALQKYGDTHRKLNNYACEKSKSIL